MIDAITTETKFNVYQVLDQFVSYIQSTRVGVTAKSTVVYLADLKSYFAYHNIDITPSKHNRIPQDRTCNNRVDRLKAYLLMLGSRGYAYFGSPWNQKLRYFLFFF